MVNKHKVFISFHHENDEKYKDELLGLNEYYDLFDDYSVRDGQIDDGLTSEQIRRKIRDEFIRNAKVLVLLCGSETKKRKHIDWEINAAMYDTDLNPRLGIVVIRLPYIPKGYVHAYEEEEKTIIADNIGWFKLQSRKEYEDHFPYMPARIIDNIEKSNGISIINWDRVNNNPQRLKTLIDNAFKRRKSISYDHSRNLKGRNS